MGAIAGPRRARGISFIRESGTASAFRYGLTASTLTPM
jgi:hypothetical protein